MAYIEKDRDGEFFCPASCTVEVNPDSNTGSNTSTSEYDENLARWKWLIDDWSDMSFKDKMTLFTKYIDVVRLTNATSGSFSTVLNTNINNVEYNCCRKFLELKYDEDHHGTPCFAMIYDAIDVDQIPDAGVRNEVRKFGETYGFIPKSSVPSTDCTCHMHK